MKILMALFAFASVAQTNDTFVINTNIYENKQFIGAPTLVVHSNKDASISVEGLYDFSLNLISIDATTVNLKTELKTEEGEPLSSSFIVQLGKEASIDIGDKTLSIRVNKSNN